MLEPLSFECTLEGTNVRLVKYSHQYDDEMWQAIEENREHLRRYLFWVDKIKTVDDVASSTRKFKKQWAEQTNFTYIITDKHSQKLIGCIDIHDIDRANQIASLGYWLRKDKTGFGYMSDAVKTLEKSAFNHGLHRLEICCDTTNKASSSVALRNGYQFEGTQKESIYAYGKFCDRNVYAKINH